jgi:hypothetical protein
VILPGGAKAAAEQYSPPHHVDKVADPGYEHEPWLMAEGSSCLLLVVTRQNSASSVLMVERAETIWTVLLVVGQRK